MEKLERQNRFRFPCVLKWALHDRKMLTFPFRVSTPPIIYYIYQSESAKKKNSMTIFVFTKNLANAVSRKRTRKYLCDVLMLFGSEHEWLCRHAYFHSRLSPSTRTFSFDHFFFRSRIYFFFISFWSTANANMLCTDEPRWSTSKWMWNTVHNIPYMNICSVRAQFNLLCGYSVRNIIFRITYQRIQHFPFFFHHTLRHHQERLID